MEYKISQLVEKTGVPKSTILYYIKEGLLPEARKLKPNVHRYSDEHVERLKYIRYMQEQMGSTNDQIKAALKNANRSFSSSLTMIEPLMNTLSRIPADAEHYTKAEFADAFSLDAALVERLLEAGLLLPTAEDDFTHKDAAIVKLAEMFESVGVAPGILKTYAEHANALAVLERQMQQQLCKARTDENFSTLWKILFETLFTAKPYLFDRTAYHAFVTALKEELDAEDVLE
jgi:DNA-binding transcriptional MerR regulator